MPISALNGYVIRRERGEGGQRKKGKEETGVEFGSGSCSAEVKVVHSSEYVTGAGDLDLHNRKNAGPAKLNFLNMGEMMRAAHLLGVSEHVYCLSLFRLSNVAHDHVVIFGRPCDIRSH